MILRSVLTAALLLGLVSTSMSYAAEHGYHQKRRHCHHCRVRRHDLPPTFGSLGVGDLFEPYIYFNRMPTYNIPYYQNQTFWERVQTQPDFPVR